MTSDLAAGRLRLSRQRRRELAVLFAHLIEDRRPPNNLCAAAGEHLGLSPTQVKRRAYKVRDRLNELRPVPVRTLEGLGYYLVVVAQEIGPDDLDEQGGPGSLPERNGDGDASHSAHRGRRGGR